jgi:hypothetical protein
MQIDAEPSGAMPQKSGFPQIGQGSAFVTRRQVGLLMAYRPSPH